MNEHKGKINIQWKMQLVWNENQQNGRVKMGGRYLFYFFNFLFEELNTIALPDPCHEKMNSFIYLPFK